MFTQLLITGPFRLKLLSTTKTVKLYVFLINNFYTTHIIQIITINQLLKYYTGFEPRQSDSDIILL